MGQTLSRKDRILNGDKVAFPTKSEQILMKHVEGGGSGGGLQLEQIGTTHNISQANWGGTCKYFKIGENLFLIDIECGGQPVTKKITIDTHPNIKTLSPFWIDHGICTSGIMNNTQGGRTNGKIDVKDGTLIMRPVIETGSDDPSLSSINGTILVIAELADNIT